MFKFTYLSLFKTTKMSSPARPDLSTISTASAGSLSHDHSPKEEAATAGLSKLSQHGTPAKFKHTATAGSRFNPTPAPKVKINTVKFKAPTALMHSKQSDAEGIALPDTTDSEDASGTSDWGAEYGHESKYDSAVESHASSARSSNGKAAARSKGNQQQLIPKTLKRVRGNSFSAATPPKRVRSTPLSRSAPRASSASVDLIPSKFT